MKTVTATNLACNLKQVLDAVEFKSEELIIIRNDREIARVIPLTAHQTALEAMSDLYRTLSGDAAKNWVKQSRSAKLINKLRSS